MSELSFIGAGVSSPLKRDATIDIKRFIPVEFKVVIEPDEVEFKSAGGIVLVDATTDKDKQKQVIGRLISVGGNAFEDWRGRIPKPGDRVYYAKWSGVVLKGDDGRDYRMTNDKDISAVIES